MATTSAISRRTTSGRAGSGVVIRRDLQAISRRVKTLIADRKNPYAYLRSIQGKGRFTQTNVTIDRLASFFKGGANLRSSDARRNSLRRVDSFIRGGLKVARSKSRAAKSNVRQAAALNRARKIKTRAKVTKRTVGGVIYKVNPSGTFERVGFTQAEQARRNRIARGTATTKDLFAGANQRTLQGQLTIFNRTIRSAQGAEKQRRINSMWKQMKEGGKKPPKAAPKAKKKKPSGTIGPATKIQKAQMKLGQLAEARQKGIKNSKGLAALYGVLGVPLGFVQGISNTAFSILKPKETLASLKQFASQLKKSPIKTTVSVARGASQSFITDPAVFIGEYYAYGKITNKAISVTRRSPFGRVLQKELFLLQQPKELRLPMRKILNAAEAQKKLNPVPRSDIKKISFFDVKELNKVEAKALATALRKTDSVVFGSKASRVLSRGKTKIPKDVDLATKDTAKFKKAFLDALPAKVRKNYKSARESISRGGEKILDIKPLNRLIPERSILTRTGYIPVSGYVTRIDLKGGSVLPRRKAFSTAFEVKTAPLVKISGIKLTGFGEQTMRKALGTLQVLVEKNARRAKDPSALLESLQIQLQALKKSKKLTLLKRRKIKQLSDAIKLLKSKQFQKLLDKKVPGLTKEYPLLGKLTKAKHNSFLNKLKKKPKAKPTKKVAKKKAPKKVVRRTAKKAKKKSSSLVPKKKRASKVPSRVPSKLKSKLSSKLRSKAPSRLSSKLKSKVPSKPPSKVPAKGPSKVPSRPPSRVPSRVPSKPPSKVPGRAPGRKKTPPKPVKVVLPKSDKLKSVAKPKGYDVYVRTKGKFKRLNKQAYTKAGASKFGRWLTNNSLARSFIVVGVSRKANKLPQYVQKTSSGSFRKPKPKSRLPKRTTIEKRKAAINTRGEKKRLRAAQVLKRARKVPKKKKRARKAKKRPSKRK